MTCFLFDFDEKRGGNHTFVVVVSFNHFTGGENHLSMYFKSTV
jgi:hypothetical protein